jgi:hypothetical protein
LNYTLISWIFIELNIATIGLPYYTHSAMKSINSMQRESSSITVILKRQCQPQCICLHFTLKVMECQQITIINISLVLCRYNSVKMSKYNHRMVEIYDGLKTKTWITLPMLLFEHCLSAQCIVVDIVPLIDGLETRCITH